MLRELTSKQITEWLAFWILEPWGTETDFLRTGVLASIMHNAWGGKPSRSPADFIPKFGKKKKQSAEEQKAALLRIFQWGKKAGLTKEKERGR